jgi:hypothetical protein
MAIEVEVDLKDDAPEMETIRLAGGDEYEFFFPKVGALLSRLRRAGQESKTDEEKGEKYFELQMSWLERGFGEDVWEEITDRLEDEDDKLEQGHLTQAFRLLLKAASGGRPTTSSNGSSRSRSASKRKAAPSRRVSDSETSTSASVAT